MAFDLTTYSGLKTFLASHLIRSGMDDAIAAAIAMAEADFKRDFRVRKLTNRGTVQISAESVTLPSDLMQIESWYHDGTAYYGPIEIVDVNALSDLKRQYGASGAPLFAAIVEKGKARTVPVADTTYNTRMVYWRTIVPLSDSQTTNWLLTSHPDIYVYAALKHLAPYLKDDDRLPLFDTILQRAYDSLEQDTQNQMTGGAMRRTVRPIG